MISFIPSFQDGKRLQYFLKGLQTHRLKQASRKGLGKTFDQSISWSFEDYGYLGSYARFSLLILTHMF